MKWLRIDKKGAAIPKTGDYRSWKPLLAKEGKMQCVYCCIHESQFGGTRNFHVEHFRPKARFPALRNSYSNLFYACGVCNVFKSDDWPGDYTPGDLTKPAYPDPSEIDYGSFLHVDDSTGEVSGDGVTGRYIVERLHLNRPHMVAVRVLSALFFRLDSSRQQIEQLLQRGQIPDELKDDVINVLINTCKVLRRYAYARPYGSDQLR